MPIAFPKAWPWLAPSTALAFARRRAILWSFNADMRQPSARTDAEPLTRPSGTPSPLRGEDHARSLALRLDHFLARVHLVDPVLVAAVEAVEGGERGLGV